VMLLSSIHTTFIHKIGRREEKIFSKKLVFKILKSDSIGFV
jgi:hypothetical protein